MGSSQSLIAPASAAAVAAAAGAVAYHYLHSTSPAPAHQLQQPPPPSSASSAALTSASSSAPASSSKKASKKKRTTPSPAQSQSTATASSQHTPLPEPVVVPFPPVIPGGFAPEQTADAAGDASKAPKKKKKKGAKKGSASAGGAAHTPADALSESSATAPESALPSSSSAPPKKSRTPPGAAGTGSLREEPWTRVESRKRRAGGASAAPSASAPAGAGEPQRPLENSVISDAGLTTTATGYSSPTTERTEDDELEPAEGSARAGGGGETARRPLAERMLPKPRKTGVEEYVSALISLLRDQLTRTDLPTQHARDARLPPACARHARRPASGRAPRCGVLMGGLRGRRRVARTGRWG